MILAGGGSACADGGAGMLQALGAEVMDVASRPIGPGGRALLDAVWLDLTSVQRRLDGVDVVLASDVDNPLIGPTGAALMYGLQKGPTRRNVMCWITRSISGPTSLLPSLGKTTGGHVETARPEVSVLPPLRP